MEIWTHNSTQPKTRYQKISQLKAQADLPPVNRTYYQLNRWLGGFLNWSGHFGEQKIIFFLTEIELRHLDCPTPLYWLPQPGFLITQTSAATFPEAQIAPANALGFQFLSPKREISYALMTMTNKTTIHSSVKVHCYSILRINRLKLKQVTYAAATLLWTLIRIVVSMDTIFVNNQLDAQFPFHVCLLQFSTCFGQPCAHHQEN
jgi:hypothetical protein